MDIYGDRLYLEIHTTHASGQEELNKGLVSLGQEMGLPLIAAIDSHYPCASDYDLHQLWLRAQMSAKKGGAKVEGGDDSKLFAGRQDYHMMTRDEVRKHLDYLPESAIEEAVDNTVALVGRCEPYKIVKLGTPMYSPDRGRKYATDRLFAVCKANWERKILNRRHTKPIEAYLERFEYEMKILIAKDFTDYFMIVHDYTRWVKDRGILVGPGRGSGAASLIAYLADITEVDPLEYDLPFARFITIDREDPPDFDLDFPASKRAFIQQGITERWGFDYVMRVGTHTRLKNKGAIRDMYRVLRDSMTIDFADVDAICKIIDDEESGSAGLGFPWDQVMLSAEEALAPYIKRYPMLFEAASRVAGRLKSYGRHAAGLVISTEEPLSGTLPMRKGAEEEGNDQMIAEFDYRALETLGLLKFDILTLRTLDTLQRCLELIKERRGVSIDLYEWQHEFDDPQVWEAFSEGNTLGVFTFETSAMTELIKRIRPDSISVLAAINALGRPGPLRSGATELYIRRRAGQEEMSYDHPLMEQVVSSTYGLILFQEQVMRTTQVLAGFSDAESEKVRKILGKKLKDQVEAKGEEFVQRAWEANQVEESVARKIWDQMATFSLYGFNLAHSVSYAMLGYYCGWCRVHYPEEFFTAVLSTVDKDAVPKFVNECKKLGFAVLPPDINESKKDFTAKPLSVRYGLLGIKDVGDKAVDAIIAAQPFMSFEQFREAMKGTACNMGTIKTLAAVGAFDSLYANRKQLETFLELESEGEDARCIHRDPSSTSSRDFICHYDWDNEPVELTAKGKPKVRKDRPKICTKVCRHYEPIGLPTAQIEPYTQAEIREKEMEYLGVWLSSTPFDRIPSEAWQDNDSGLRLYRGSEVLLGQAGIYMVAGIPQAIKPHRTKAGDPMAFVELLCYDEVVSMAVFPSDWKCRCPERCVRHQIRIGKMGLYEIRKKERKYQLKAFNPISD
jgi:DNA polymerase-3 subunit alpha